MKSPYPRLVAKILPSRTMMAATTSIVFTRAISFKNHVNNADNNPDYYSTENLYIRIKNAKSNTFFHDRTRIFIQ
jgi:hypothetical protein